MGFISNKTERSEIIAGDHIYTYRAVFTYSHHGIYVGGNTVVHFTSVANADKSFFQSTSFASSKTPSTTCAAYEDCGFRQAEIYRFEYGVSNAKFCAKVRGGSCTTSMSDEPDAVTHRANFLLHNGFGNYNLFENNCEDFALYCKTGLLSAGSGISGQVFSAFGAAPVAGLVSYHLKFLIPKLVVATVTAGMTRYATDIGVRDDVVKVHVEDLQVMLAGLM